MGKFLSNERKVILKSAGTGVGIISLLSLALLTESVILWALALFGTIAVYWCVPTWFSRSRQLEKRESKPISPKEEIQTTNPEYRYFNAEDEEVRILSDREKFFSFGLFVVINLFLIYFAYEKLADIFISIFPKHEKFIIHLLFLLAFSTPFLIRHIYCFMFNRPMDTSLTFNGSNTPYIHKYDSRSSQSYNFATNPIYSYMPSNQYHYRHK